jgi:sulfur-oxidizing protein SoxY
VVNSRISRREFATVVGGAAVLSLFPRSAGAEGSPRAPDGAHRLTLDVPVLADDPASVPLVIAVDHPMETDHYIRSIEVDIERDPVPRKGKFVFSPANGRAAVAYQMRSGTGGVVRAVAECTRHGAFVVSREVRVVDGGCSTPPERGARDRAGSPEIRLPRSIAAREPFDVRARLLHNSYTGLVERQGKFVRELPEFYVKQMLVWLDDRQVSEFQMTPAVSPNPVIRFPLRLTQSATLRVQFLNSEGQRWEVSQPLKV